MSSSSRAVVSIRVDRAKHDFVSISAWALNRVQSNHNKNELVYISMEDSQSRQLPFVTTWLQQWQPEAIYIGCSKEIDRVAALEEWMVGWSAQFETNESDSSPSGEHSAAAVPNERVVFLIDLVEYSENALQKALTILQQLVKGDKAASYGLALSGNADLVNNKPLLQALVLLLQTTGLWMSTADDRHKGKYMVMPDAKAPFLRLDNTATTAMHVWPIQHQGEANFQGNRLSTDSLWGILSKDCLTKMGNRLMKHWLLQPLTDLAQLSKRQAAVSFLVDHGHSRDALRNLGLRPMKIDLDELAQRLGKYADDGSVNSTKPDTTENAVKVRSSCSRSHSICLPCVFAVFFT
jgi:DNA mismatch repair ATPase MutS